MLFCKGVRIQSFQEKMTFEKFDEKNHRMYKSRILRKNSPKFNAYFDGTDTM